MIVDPQLRDRVLQALGVINERHGTHNQKTHGRPGTKGLAKKAVKKAAKEVVEAVDRPQQKQPATPAQRLAPKLAKSVASGVKSSKAGRSGSSTLTVVTFNDGAKAIRKKFHSNDDGPARQKADSAELVSALARSLSVAAPEVHRINSSELYVEHIDSPNALDDPRLSADSIAKLAASGQGRILGLVDLLTDYDDRDSRENWSYDNGWIVPLDNDTAWQLSTDPAKPPPAKYALSPFSRPYVSGSSWAQNALTKAETDEVRRRLTALRPQFEVLGRGDWLDFSLARLDAIAAHAKGGARSTERQPEVRDRGLRALGVLDRAVDVNPGGEQLHHYWTKGEGLAKWAKSPHPWTALYRHLVKYVGPARAKRMASQWHKEVFGIWVGEKKGDNPLGPG